jgi:hypothetical protein
MFHILIFFSKSLDKFVSINVGENRRNIKRHWRHNIEEEDKKKITEN